MSDLTAVNGNISKAFNNLGLVSAELPLSKVRELAQSGNVEYISPERAVQSFQHIADATGYYIPGISDNGDTDANTWLSGGVGHIAVIDSGIDPSHKLLNWGSTTKVKYNQDFTGENITGDPYGHGSHVASMFAGDPQLNGGIYQGVASASNLINLRVLNSYGLGSTSNLIAALDWAVANKTNWNIRVINMSLGTAARDSYKNDPLCLAARRAVNAGIVVVASAGNFGKDLLGNKLYGTIGSPGIEPSVITVGAANTYGTSYRGDDTVATFSSRGPTRGYVTLANGARKYDNLIKPDLIAPGNKIIGARGYYNGTANYLSTTNASLNTGSATSNNEKVMYLSGTSMAAPIVAGAASLLIQTNPNLTPNLVKANAGTLIVDSESNTSRSLMNPAVSTRSVSSALSGTDGGSAPRRSIRRPRVRDRHPGTDAAYVGTGSSVWDASSSIIDCAHGEKLRSRLGGNTHSSSSGSTTNSFTSMSVPSSVATQEPPGSWVGACPSRLVPPRK